MVNMPIHNETDYALTEAMIQHILRDAQEHFGEEVSSIRVQSGLERHAFNARTHEVRYAFSPNDFGLVPTMPTAPETPRSRQRPPRRDARAEILPAPFEDVAVDAEEPAPRDTSLGSIAAGRDEDDDVFKLDDQNDDQDDAEEDAEEDEGFFDTDAYDAS